MGLWNVDKEAEFEIFFSTVRAGLPKVPKGMESGGPQITQIDGDGVRGGFNRPLTDK
jgi:hypothetical protein